MTSTFGLKLMDGSVIQERPTHISDDAEALPTEEAPDGQDAASDDGEGAGETPEELAPAPAADKKPVPYDRFQKKVQQNRELLAELQKARDDLNATRLETTNRTNEILSRMIPDRAAPPAQKTELDKIIEGMTENNPEVAQAIILLNQRNEVLQREVFAARRSAQDTHDKTRSLASERFADQVRVAMDVEIGGEAKLDTREVHKLIANSIAGYIASADQKTFKPEHAIAHGKEVVADLKKILGIKAGAKPAAEPSPRDRAPRAPARPGGAPGAGPRSGRAEAVDLIRSVQSGMK